MQMGLGEACEAITMRQDDEECRNSLFVLLGYAGWGNRSGHRKAASTYRTVHRAEAVIGNLTYLKVTSVPQCMN
jgi:hypothetical protein